MKIPKRGKCDGCTTKDVPVMRPVYASEPNVVNFDFNEDSRSMTIDLEIPIACAECDNEVGRITFSMEDFEIPDGAEIEWDNE